MAISRQHPEFQKISGNFQEWWNFEIPHWKSSSLTKNEWEIYPICWNQSKLANSRAFLESWNPGFQDPEIITYFKKCKKLIQICYVGYFLKNFIKNTFFWKSPSSPGKPLIPKKTKSIDELILTWKFFLAEHESCYFSKVFKVNVVLDFRFDEF